MSGRFLNNLRRLVAGSAALLFVLTAPNVGVGALVGYWNLNNQAEDQAGAIDLTAVGEATFAARTQG